MNHYILYSTTNVQFIHVHKHNCTHNSDKFIHGTNKLYVILTLFFTSFSSVHTYSPESIILATMIPIPKDQRNRIRDFNKYRVIMLSSMS